MLYGNQRSHYTIPYPEPVKCSPYPHTTFPTNLVRATEVGNDNRLRWMYRQTRHKHAAC